jgi:hypothetical protein
LEAHSLKRHKKDKDDDDNKKKSGGGDKMQAPSLKRFKKGPQ